jgi:hypothetical protein
MSIIWLKKILLRSIWSNFKQKNIEYEEIPLYYKKHLDFKRNT